MEPLTTLKKGCTVKATKNLLDFLFGDEDESQKGLSSTASLILKNLQKDFENISEEVKRGVSTGNLSRLTRIVDFKLKLRGWVDSKFPQVIHIPFYLKTNFASIQKIENNLSIKFGSYKNEEVKKIQEGDKVFSDEEFINYTNLPKEKAADKEFYFTAQLIKRLTSPLVDTDKNYRSELVADVKKFLYEEESPYKTIQPFISQLSILDVLDEEELVSILSYFIKDFEGVFVTSTYTERDSVFVKEINLRDISLPPILTNNSNDIDEHIIVSGEDVKEIFKRFKRLNLKEEDFSFYLNSYSRNSFANKIAIGNVDNEFEDKIFTHLKQLQKLVQTYSSTKNLNQMYIGDDSSVKTVTIENVKFFRKLFSEISVDKYLVESDELVNILQEFYFIPKDKIKVEEERQSYLYSILRSKRVELKEFVSDLLNHSSKTN